MPDMTICGNLYIMSSCNMVTVTRVRHVLYVPNEHGETIVRSAGAHHANHRSHDRQLVYGGIVYHVIT